LNFVKSFLCIYWDDHMICINQLVTMVYHIDLCVLKNPCILDKKPTWSYVFLMCSWILFTGILLRIFTSMFINDIEWYWPVIFFLSFFFFFFFFVCVTSLSGFGIKVQGFFNTHKSMWYTIVTSWLIQIIWSSQ